MTTKLIEIKKMEKELLDKKVKLAKETRKYNPNGSVNKESEIIKGEIGFTIKQVRISGNHSINYSIEQVFYTGRDIDLNSIRADGWFDDVYKADTRLVEIKDKNFKEVYYHLNGSLLTEPSDCGKDNLYIIEFDNFWKTNTKTFHATKVSWIGFTQREQELKDGVLFDNEQQAEDFAKKKNDFINIKERIERIRHENPAINPNFFFCLDGNKIVRKEKKKNEVIQGVLYLSENESDYFEKTRDFSKKQKINFIAYKNN